MGFILTMNRVVFNVFYRESMLKFNSVAAESLSEEKFPTFC